MTATDDDARPYTHLLQVSREATDEIQRASNHVDELGRWYGEKSKEYLEAAASWQRQLSRLFSMSMGANTRVTRDGHLSLFVSTAGGFVYGLIWHGHRRTCINEGCYAVMNDDGTTWTYSSGYGTCEETNTPHRPNRALEAPTPGSWSFHS
jgi:hypothetical protein